MQVSSSLKLLQIRHERTLSFTLDRKENKAIVEKAVSELCNTDLRVKFILTAEMKQSVDVRSNPFIKSALEMFGGRVVKEG